MGTASVLLRCQLLCKRAVTAGGACASALLLLLVCAFSFSGPAAASGLDAGTEQQVRTLALDGLKTTVQNLPGEAGGVRVEVEVGRLDARLRLAPCARVQPHLPPGAKLWGRTRIGLRCVEGAVPWNVYLPITVKVWGQALVAAAPLAAGSVVGPNDVALAEVDLAQQPSAAVAEPALAVGRTVARAMAPGESLREWHLKARQWFAAGDRVQLVIAGDGFTVGGVAEALTPGFEGQAAKVRTESGRILTGMPAGERRLEVAL